MAKIKEEKKAKNSKADKKTAPQKPKKAKTKNASAKAQTKKAKNESFFENKGPRSKKSNVKIIFLGGVDGIGMNCTAFEYDDDIILVDCGVSFPEDDMLGVDLVIPDFTYLEDNINKIKGLLITHGHEDHIGAVPYFLKKFPQVPVFATRLTLGIIEGKISEHGIRNAKLEEVHAGMIVGLGNFDCEFIHVNHSMPDACAICITTPNGRILHTGDFKVDFTPVEEKPIDLARIAELGRKGIRLLLCDSTNAERAGYTPSESSVAVSFDRIFNNESRRVVIATFSSNVHRVQQIINASEKYGRKVAVSGRSMLNFVNAATKLGYLYIPENMMIDLNDAQKYPPEMVTVITTGSQGEPMSALYRMAFGEHNQVSLGSNDLVVLSSSAIPGNEKLITKIINELFKRGTEVITYSNYDVHVSGHACREELKLIHSLTSPEFFMPVHGEYKHLIAHANLAHEMGMAENRIVIPEIGRVVEMGKRGIVPTDHVQAGAVMVDGTGAGEVSDIVLRDRKRLSEDGIIIVTAGVDLDFMAISVYPEVISRGFVYEKENEDLIGRITESARNSLIRNLAKGIDDIEVLRSKLRDDVAEYARKRTKHRPMIVVMLSDIQQ
ncbi:MAG: ribonuclease J [Ruminococcaceae bacterium]|nr:ribonuclease J [Oscillospiraceae bacterium]